MSCYYSHCSISFKHKYSTFCAFQVDPLCEFEESILPSQIFNSKGFNKTRKMLDNNSWPSGCDHCRIPESKDLKSSRQDHELQHKNLERVEIRFSNACNMACLHCSPEYSSLWAKKLNYSGPTLGLTSEQVLLICEDLKNISTIRRIVLSGGEPLVNKNFYKCLEVLSEHSHANEIVLSFHTNLNPGRSINFDYLNEALKKFKEAYMVVSVDGGKKLYPIFRGGDWNILLSNIEKAVQMDINVDGTMSLTTYQMDDIINCYLDVLPLGFRELRTMYVSTPKNLDPKHSATKKNMKDFDYVLNHIENNYSGSLRDSSLWYLNICKERLI
tara:strand:+ start:770 stop:1753 length:984 start_codon:yes stop_codon:yes gene_type:complete